MIEERFEKFAFNNHLEDHEDDTPMNDHDCYKEVVEEYYNVCTQGEYDLKFYDYFV